MAVVLPRRVSLLSELLRVTDRCHFVWNYNRFHLNHMFIYTNIMTMKSFVRTTYMLQSGTCIAVTYLYVSLTVCPRVDFVTAP